MEQENRSSDLFNNEMAVDPMAKQYILSMARWAIVIVAASVFGYVLSIIDLFRDKPAYSSSSSEGFEMGFSQTFEKANIVTSVVMIIVGLLINYFLFRFASLAKSGVEGLDQSKLTRSFNNLKAYFMACSIVLIIVFVYVLLIGIVAGARAV